MADTKENKKDMTRGVNASDKKSCFIITPIGQFNSDIYIKAFGLIKAVIKPVLVEFDFEPIAASDMPNAGSINRQILNKLYDDELVIANLTGLNPNVMYELAVRHAVRKPVIIMAENGTNLPFDLKDQRCIFYDDTLHGVEIAKDTLREFLKVTIDEKLVSNPIYDAIKEKQILKALDGTTDEPLKYIISRIDSIDRALNNDKQSGPMSRVVKNLTTNSTTYPTPELSALVFNPVGISIDELYERVKAKYDTLQFGLNPYAVKKYPNVVIIEVPWELARIVSNAIGQIPGSTRLL